MSIDNLNTKIIEKCDTSICILWRRRCVASTSPANLCSAASPSFPLQQKGAEGEASSQKGYKAHRVVI
jgi:hypothetical protein